MIRSIARLSQLAWMVVFAVTLIGPPAAAENPCNPCAANPCASNPCNPCGANPCNPCGANPAIRAEAIRATPVAEVALTRRASCSRRE